MGGHGGLNILPQKRWNVYNRDNRLKVEQDEAKAKKKEDEARERHEQAEREARHQQLLQRSGASAGQGGGQGPAEATPIEHINFWKEEEIKLQHPDNEKQQREELKRRGNPDFYTSDAKFDERFALAYGLGGDKPWYAQALKPEPEERPATAAAMSLPGSGVTAIRANAGVAAKVGSAAQQPQLPKRGQPHGRLAGRGASSSSSSGSDRDSGSTSTSTTTSSSTSALTSSSDDSDSSSSSGSSSSGSEDSSEPDDRRKRKRRRTRSPSRKRGSDGTHRDSSRKRRRRSSSDGDTKRKTRRREREGSRSKSRSKKASKSKLSKTKSKSKERRRRRDSDRQVLDAAAAGGSKSLEQLRAERLAREKEERLKQRGLLASVAVLPDGPPDKGYNSTFGYAAALKRRRTQ